MKKEVEEFWNKPENLKILPVLIGQKVSSETFDEFLEKLKCAVEKSRKND